MLGFWAAMCGSAQTLKTVEPIATSITVAEKITQESPAPVTVLDSIRLQRSPGVNLDDRLRLVPGFTLFRRTSSLAANPTTQGVSLRGLGSTGASRTLVLWDGVPLNSPFGGWVYWTRVNPEELERLEMARGASTSLFGDRAMGGGLSLFSRAADRTRANAGYEGGNRGTHQLNAGGAWTAGRYSLSGQARAFTTEGYYIVPATARGAVDTRAGVEFTAATLRFDRAGSRDRLWLRGDILAEARENGTTLTRNSTGLGTLAANYGREIGRGAVSLLGFHSREEFRASFSQIAPGRVSERLTMFQSVPAEATGGAAFLRAGGNALRWTAGFDAVRAEGRSRETSLPAGFRAPGGSQFQRGLFAQGDARWAGLQWFGGLRRQWTGAGNTFWSPSGGTAWGRGPLRLRASAYRAFRAPTLNELYREFRVGNAVTLANDGLRAEALRGVETGLDLRLEKTQITVSAFHNALTDLVTNVTISSTPQLITRQRRNAAAARNRGLEAEVRRRIWLFDAEASYLLVDARFRSGERIPQVARSQGTGQLIWQRKGTLIAGGLRANAAQFEDDLNRFLLPGFAVWHVSLRQGLSRGLAWTLAFENLFNREFVAGFSPTPLTGAPRLWRSGIQWHFR